MAINMKSLTQALAKTAAAIEKTVQTTVQEVTGPKALQDYDLLEQVASGGPALAWKLFSARPRNKNSLSQYSQVCVWYLDKKTLSDARQKAGLSKSAEDAFLDILRADAARLVRLRHPGVVHVVQGLDESKVAMALVTEPIFSSLANAMGDLSNISEVPKDLKAIDMSELEIKHGLLQLSESLAFLHNNARLVHRAISPETVFITATGAWKLGCFGFAISANQATDAETIQPFHYPEYDVEDSVVPLQPSLNYTAPELVRSNPSSISYACDIFSLGCLIYHLLTKRPLLDCHNNARMFMSKVQYLSHENFSDISPDLIPNLREMLSPNETSRPSALDFTGSSYFRDDTRLRALRFLDHMLEIDNMKKSEFLKALAGMWKDFDARVLRYKVLPPLCAELRNVVIQQMILPMVLTIAESQDKNDFEISTLPALVPVFSSATGDTLLLLVKHAELIINKADQEQLVAHILPLLVRAYDDPDVRIQEEVLKRTVALAKQLDFQVMKQSVLPRVHGLALKTTVAAVRVNALMCLGELVHWLDKRAVLDILQTLQRCTAVDHSAPTLMSTLGVAQAIYKQYGLEFAVEHLLPLLAPLLVAQQLNLQQFAKYMLFVKEILRKVEEKRGVTLSEMGSSRDISSNIIGVNSSYMESMKSVSFAGNKHSNSWDSEDWGKIAKSSNSSASLNHSSPDAKFSLKSALKDSLKTVSVQPDTASKNESWYLDDWVSTAKDSKSVAGVSHSSLDGRVAFNNMMKEPQNSSMQMMEHSVGPNLLTSQASISITCAPADTLWPTPSTVTSVLSTSESTASFSEYGSWSTSTDGGLPGTGKMKSKLNNPTASVGSMSSIDVIDPFADWPPRANANSAVNQTRQIPSSGHVVRAENTPIQNASSVDMASNLGLQFSQSAAPENHNPTDIGTIFPSTKTDPVPLKIAPPPSGGSKGIGRGRGRARTSVQARSNSSNEGNSKTHGSQPPLLDLL